MTPPASGPGPGPATQAVFDAVRRVWPEHDRYLRHSQAVRLPATHEPAERVASIILRVAEQRGRPLEELAEAYRFLVEQIIYPEEWHFRREGRYRLSTFADAARLVYSNESVMARYMDGVLLSHCIWDNHVRAFDHFTRVYLPGCPAGARHLEIGPGHGLLLSFAASCGRFDELRAWDVSPTSLERTARLLDLLGHAGRVTLQQRDLLAPAGDDDADGAFQSIVLSEVLEHLERPGEALASLRRLLAPGGTAWINVPGNSPTLDHIFLFRGLDDVVAQVRDAGLRVVETEAFPAAGESLPRAIKGQLPVSYVVIAERPRGRTG